jgi:preprotein translocase subunit SecE
VATTTDVAPRPSLPARLGQFYQDVRQEMQRVTWPDRAQLQDSTIKIIVFVLALGLMIWVMDVALQFVLVRLPAMVLGR